MYDPPHVWAWQDLLIFAAGILIGMLWREVREAWLEWKREKQRGRRGDI